VTIEISIEWLFFVIPFTLAWAFSLRTSESMSMGGSERMWYWIFVGPMTMIFSLTCWGLYLKFMGG
jgi:hypothetical protein